MKNLPAYSLAALLISTCFLLGAADSCRDSSAHSKLRTTAAGRKQSGQHPGMSKSGESFRERMQEGVQHFWESPEIVKELGLSGEEIQALQEEAKSFRAIRDKQRMGMRHAYQLMLRILRQEEVNEAAFEKAAQNFREAGNLQRKAMTTQLMHFREILSLKQWKDLARLRPRALQIERFRPAKVNEASTRAFISDREPQMTQPGSPTDPAKKTR